MDIDDYVLTAALICLAILIVIGLLQIKKSIRMASDRLLPMYAKDIDHSWKVANNAHLISENVIKRQAAITQSLQRLQEVVERELAKKRPTYCTSTTQTMMADTVDSATFTSPGPSPRIVDPFSTSPGPSTKRILVEPISNEEETAPNQPESDSEPVPTQPQTKDSIVADHTVLQLE